MVFEVDLDTDRHERVASARDGEPGKEITTQACTQKSSREKYGWGDGKGYLEDEDRSGNEKARIERTEGRRLFMRVTGLMIASSCPGPTPSAACTPQPRTVLRRDEEVDTAGIRPRRGPASPKVVSGLVKWLHDGGIAEKGDREGR